MIKTYIICNKDKEDFRFKKLLFQIQQLDINLPNYEIFNFIWGDEITDEIRNKYCKTDYSMKYHGRNIINNPLTNGEISLFLNYIECLRKIRREFKEGNFLILESDVIFSNEFNHFFKKIVESLPKLNNWDIINIGCGSRNYLKRFNYPKTIPFIINNIKFHNENINCCAESIIWNYKSICKFLDYFEINEDIDSPIDTKMDIFSDVKNKFNIFWSVPFLIKQGSLEKMDGYQSTLH
jgi:GR25 family glycosyltransferase involved in LPS biosynthesis